MKQEIPGTVTELAMRERVRESNSFNQFMNDDLPALKIERCTEQVRLNLKSRLDWGCS